MIVFKGILKYLIYISIIGWMFLLGIMVGRGTSPVEFDTHSFQKRLETIASEFGKNKGEPKKIDLKFYEVLDHPVPEEGTPSKTSPLEIMPRKEIRLIADTIPLKTSQKKRRLKKKESDKKKGLKLQKHPLKKMGNIRFRSLHIKRLKMQQNRWQCLKKKDLHLIG